MEVEIDLTKSVDQNAGIYFDLAKKSRKKLEGANAALLETKKKIKVLEQNEAKFWQEEKNKQAKKERKREWYERFHWFFSSEDFLCLGGKDATSNEIIIKKHTDKDDLVLHTEMPGSPFFVIKNGQAAGKKTIEEAAQSVAVHSRAWKSGHASADVFYVKPEQVTKEARAGEHLAKGSFMVYGTKNFLHPKVEYALGLVNEQIIGGPIESVSKKTSKYVIVVPGKEKKGALAKKIRSLLKGGDLDDLDRFLPAGGGDIKKKSLNNF